MIRVKFEPNITVGTLLTITTLIISAFGIWHKLDIEMKVMQQQMEGLRSDYNASQRMIEIHASAINELKMNQAKLETLLNYGKSLRN